MSTDASTGSAPASTGGAPVSSGQEFSWGDGWRQHLAAGSTDAEKELKQLERYESPEQVWRKARELETKISSGEFQAKLPKDADEKQLAQWRKDNGLPEKPEGYTINMPEGRDKPPEDDGFLKSFLESAHKNNYSQSQVDGAIAAFYAQVDAHEEAMTEAEKAAEAKAEDALRQEWGSDYRANKAMAESLLARAPKGFRDRFMNGLMDDGTPIKADPDAWRWLVQMEREINPAATVVPGTQGDIGKSIEAEINEIKTLMADKSSKYYKGPEAEALQARYRDLIVARDKLKEKSAA
jgi:hypothetical protein